MADITVLKLGGELLESRSSIARAAGSIVQLSARGSLVVVHGGGRAIDAELRARGQSPRFADGLRITDEAALDAVISVLAGRTNTTLVAAVGAAGGRAVGLTGADASIGLCERTGDFTTAGGQRIDLGLVGHPVSEASTLLLDLLALGYVPVVCSIGVDREGALLNVNADTLAGHLAGAVRARMLVIAGTTAGVLNAQGDPIARLGLDEIDSLIAAGTAHSGMIAKLAACRHALLAGTAHIAIVDGRDGNFSGTNGTRIAATCASSAGTRAGVGAAELKA